MQINAKRLILEATVGLAWRNRLLEVVAKGPVERSVARLHVLHAFLDLDNICYGKQAVRHGQ